MQSHSDSWLLTPVSFSLHEAQINSTFCAQRGAPSRPDYKSFARRVKRNPPQVACRDQVLQGASIMPHPLLVKGEQTVETS